MLARGDKLSPYETAQIWNLTAYSYYLQERYGDAINAYERVMQQPELPEALMLSTLKTKAQLQFTIEDYQGALNTVNELMSKVTEPSAWQKRFSAFDRKQRGLLEQAENA